MVPDPVAPGTLNSAGQFLQLIGAYEWGGLKLVDLGSKLDALRVKLVSKMLAGYGDLPW